MGKLKFIAVLSLLAAAFCAHRVPKSEFKVVPAAPQEKPFQARLGILLFADTRADKSQAGTATQLELIPGDADYVIDPPALVRKKLADGLAGSGLFTEVKSIPYTTDILTAPGANDLGKNFGVDYILGGELSELSARVRRTERTGSVMSLFCLSWAADFMPSSVSAHVGFENVTLVDLGKVEPVWKWRMKSITEQETAGWSRAVAVQEAEKAMELAVEALANDLQKYFTGAGK
jgi:hypothetical protein